jgi:protein TonB
MVSKNQRLILSLGISLILHGVALFPGGLIRIPEKTRQRVVFASLRIPEAPPLPPLGEAPFQAGGFLDGTTGTLLPGAIPGEAALPEMPPKASGEAGNMPEGEGLPELPPIAEDLPEIPPKGEILPGAPTEAPEKTETSSATPDALIKNTLEAEKTEKNAAPKSRLRTPESPKKPEAPGARKAELLSRKSDSSAAKPKPASKKAAPEVVESAQRKLYEHVFYPKEAIERGIEGTVYLIIRFAENGAVLDVDVAASSGNTLLDAAAVRAARAIGRQIGAAESEIILPVRFQLQD